MVSNMNMRREYMKILTNGLDLLDQNTATPQQQVRALEITSAIARRLAAEIAAKNNQLT